MKITKFVGMLLLGGLLAACQHAEVTETTESSAHATVETAETDADAMQSVADEDVAESAANDSFVAAESAATETESAQSNMEEALQGMLNYAELYVAFESVFEQEQTAAAHFCDVGESPSGWYVSIEDIANMQWVTYSDNNAWVLLRGNWERENESGQIETYEGFGWIFAPIAPQYTPEGEWNGLTFLYEGTYDMGFISDAPGCENIFPPIGYDDGPEWEPAEDAGFVVVVGAYTLWVDEYRWVGILEFGPEAEMCATYLEGIGDYLGNVNEDGNYEVFIEAQVETESVAGFIHTFCKGLAVNTHVGTGSDALLNEYTFERPELSERQDFDN